MKENLDGESSLPHKQIRLLGKEIYIYREVSSTNKVAQLRALAGAPEGTIVMSMSQTSGKGRLKRQWVCPSGKGLLMSMVLRPEIQLQFVPQLTLLCAVAVAETIRKVTGCQAGIKWPNDVLISGKKICGILAQSNFSKGGTEYVIMGVGININLNINQLPPDCRETSTSLSIEMGQNVSRLRVLKQFIITWDEHFQGFLKDGHLYLRSKWLENNVTLGRNVTLNKEINPINGLAVDISERGGLIVSLPDGTLEEFLAEDLSLGRTHYGND